MIEAMPIHVHEICGKQALSREQGEQLGQKIIEKMRDEGAEIVTLDFEGVQIGITMFYNQALHTIHRDGFQIPKFKVRNATSWEDRTFRECVAKAREVYKEDGGD